MHNSENVNSSNGASEDVVQFNRERSSGERLNLNKNINVLKLNLSEETFNFGMKNRFYIHFPPPIPFRDARVLIMRKTC